MNHKSGSFENRNGSDSGSMPVPIPSGESELFACRVRDAIGDETLRSFARRCGFSDGLLGSYLRGQKRPGLDHLVAIADASGVTVDWLATGRLPRTRREIRQETEGYAAVGDARREPPKINAKALAAILAGVLDAMGPGADTGRAAETAVRFYLDARQNGLFTDGGAEEDPAQSA